jgi:putative IMPACT (imprinted ancient) family translation regulator
MSISERARATVQEMPEQPRRLLTADQVQAAFDVITANSEATGAARGMVIRTEYKAKRVHARLTLSSPEKTDAGKKAWATAHDEYAEACEAHAQAEQQWEYLKDQRNKAELVIEAWRTMSSNERGITRAGR